VVDRGSHAHMIGWAAPGVRLNDIVGNAQGDAR
jgi:hypothetical protein